jgi:hypothetical protein
VGLKHQSYTDVNQVGDLTKAQVLKYIKDCLLQESQDAGKVDFILWRLAKRKTHLTVEVRRFTYKTCYNRTFRRPVRCSR